VDLHQENHSPSVRARKIVAAIARDVRSPSAPEAGKIEGPCCDETLLSVVVARSRRTDAVGRDQVFTASLVLGQDGAGIVEAVGSTVTNP
jgi:Zn-dependent alcohol dehydrogenase